MPDEADAPERRGYYGPSLCTPERDPLGFHCEAEEGAIGSVQALALARELVPDEPLIKAKSDSASLSLNLEGRDALWSFEFEERATGVRLWVSVVRGEAQLEREPDRDPCGEGAEIELLDSEAFVPDAVLRFEEATDRTFVGGLALEQDGCASVRPETHHVLLSPREERGPSALYFARYWDDGEFLELIGPCPYELDACLEGVQP